MAVAGAPTQCDDHALRCTRAALGIIKYIKNRNNNATFKWSLRVGLHSGPVVAGVIGNKRITYDIWGDSVNLASRMESASEPNRVNISAYTFDLIRDQFKCEYRGKIPVKGKGEILFNQLGRTSGPAVELVYFNTVSGNPKNHLVGIRPVGGNIGNTDAYPVLLIRFAVKIIIIYNPVGFL